MSQSRNDLAQPLLLDACVVVNLFATRRMEAILAAIGTPCAVVDVVYREAQYVYRGGVGDDARERERIDLGALVDSGLLTVIEVTDEDELLTFIDLAVEMDDGEAQTAAVAIHRRLEVATDDRKALRVLARHELSSRGTLALIRDWADQSHADSESIRSTLIDLRQRGNYLPGRQHPLKAWWDANLSESGE